MKTYSELCDLFWNSTGGTRQGIRVVVDAVRAESAEEIARLKEALSHLVKVGESHGWNGVENSKILSVFFDNLIKEMGGEIAILKSQLHHIHAQSACNLESRDRAVGEIDELKDALATSEARRRELESVAHCGAIPRRAVWVGNWLVPLMDTPWKLFLGAGNRWMFRWLGERYCEDIPEATARRISEAMGADWSERPGQETGKG